MDAPRRALRRVRIWLGLFMAGLVLSGLTAFPLLTEVRLLREATATWPFPGLAAWLRSVEEGLTVADVRYPFLAYGTDWLAFAHLVIAIAFVGPWRDPVRNVWVVDFGMIACLLVLPLALVCGPLRGIPPFWIAIDCSFGIFGLVPLLLARRAIGDLPPVIGSEATP